MSAYKDFISDFPARCLDILHMAEKPARVQQREVTLALLVASAGFVVPFERLKPDHPIGDAARYVEACRKLNGLMLEEFLTSTLATGATSWRGGKLASILGDPDSWPELTQPKELSHKKVAGAIKVVRDALAHGNIFTHNDPISSIIFVQNHFKIKNNVKVYTGHEFVMASPKDFNTFLKAWFEFLKLAHIPLEVVAQSIDDAA